MFTYCQNVQKEDDKVSHLNILLFKKLTIVWQKKKKITLFHDDREYHMGNEKECKHLMKTQW